jgi:hypothetical protein
MDLYVSAVAIEMVSSSIHGFINVISIERFVMTVSVSQKRTDGHFLAAVERSELQNRPRIANRALRALWVYAQCLLLIYFLFIQTRH